MNVSVIDVFLLGVTAMGFLTAGLFFLQFWKDTRDSFFFAFFASFTIEAITRGIQLLLARPNEGHPAIHTVRLVAFLLILAAIIRKNFGGSS
jgi:hypothetical protein